MPLVTFKNLLDDESEFKFIDRTQLVSAVHDYAKLSDDDIYNAVLEQKVCIFVNNKRIEVDDWADCCITDNDKIVIVPELQGGGGGGWFKIAIGVVLIAAAIALNYIVPGAGQTLWGLTANQVSMLVVSMGMMGAGMILGGLSELMFSPDLPSLPSFSNDGNFDSTNSTTGASGSKQTQTYNWGGIKTLARYDTPIPIVYGTHKVGGNIISLFVDTENHTDNYLYVLLALCEGEIDGICVEEDHNTICTTSNQASSSYKYPAIELNDQPLRYYKDITWWYRKGTNKPNPLLDEFNPTAQNKIPYFDGARVQFDDGRDIATYVEYTTTKPLDMVQLYITAPSLYDASSGTPLTKLVEFKVEYKQHDAGSYTTYRGVGSVSTWTPYFSTGTPNEVSISYIDGEARKYYDPGAYKIEVLSNNYIDRYNQYWNYSTIMYAIYIRVTELSTGSVTEGNIVQSMTRDLVSNTTTGQPYMNGDGAIVWPQTIRITSENEQHSYTAQEIGMYKITLSHNVWPGWSGTMYSTETTSTAVSEWIPMQAKVTSPITAKVTLDFNNLTNANGRDLYDIKVTRKNAKSDDLNVKDDIVLSSITEIVQGAFIYPHTALLGLRIKATGQLYGGMPNITTTIRGTKVKVPTMSVNTFQNEYWNEQTDTFEDSSGIPSTWNETSYTTAWTDNAILCVRNLMLNKRYGLGKYLTETDLYTPGIVSAVKECHRLYNPFNTGTDYIDWYTTTIDSEWPSKWSVTNASLSSAVTSSVVARTISISSTVNGITLEFVTDTPLPANGSYTLGVTLASTTGSYCIEIVGKTTNGEAYYLKGGLTGSTNAYSNGTHTFVFSTAAVGITSIRITFQKFTPSAAGFTITDVSLTQNASFMDHYHTWNGVLESEQAGLMALFEMCDSFRCWPIWVGGKFNFILDRDETPVHTITEANMTEFSQAFTPLSEIPYILSGQYVDKDYRYVLRSSFVRARENTLTKASEKVIGLKGITNRLKAERELKFKLNKVTTCTRAVSFKCGLDSIHATAGDIVYIQRKLIPWGQGGRILNYNSTNKSIALEATAPFNNVSTNTYVVRYQTSTNAFVQATVNGTAMGNGATRLIKVKGWPTSTYPCTEAVYSVGQLGELKKFRLLSVTRDDSESIAVSGVQHVASLYDTEATLTKFENTYVVIPPTLENITAPINVYVVQTAPTDGIGFFLHANPPVGNYGSVDIVVQMSKENDCDFSTIAVIPMSRTSATFVDNNLTLDHTYYFKFYCKTSTTTSTAVYTSFELKGAAYTLPPPSGLRLKDTSVDTNAFDGKHIAISWNPVQITGSGTMLEGYFVEVYHDDPTPTNQLRRVFTASTEYTYTYENNVLDSKGATPYKTISFRLYTKSVNSNQSLSSQILTVVNNVPDTVSSVTAESGVGSAMFRWGTSAEDDHKSYQYKIKVGAGGSWSNYVNSTDNTYNYILTYDDITANGAHPVVYIGVKDKDFYDQVSATAVIASALADTASDNIFKLLAAKSAGTGDVTELYNGVIDSGGVTIG